MSSQQNEDDYNCWKEPSLNTPSTLNVVISVTGMPLNLPYAASRRYAARSQKTASPVGSPFNNDMLSFSDNRLQVHVYRKFYGAI